MSNGVIPTTIEAQISFIKVHADLWNAAPPEDIGLDAATVAEIFALGNLAETKQGDAEAARAASTQATSERNDVLNEALVKTAAAIKRVRAHADTAANPSAVYTKAGLPEPQTPRELKAPPAPSDLVADFANTSGDIILKWKNPTPLAFEGKTYYFIERRLASPVSGSGLPEVPFTQIGSSPERDFTDTTLPSGYTEVYYRVIATRNKFNSQPSEPAMLLLGVSNVTQVTELTPNGAQTLKEEAA